MNKKPAPALNDTVALSKMLQSEWERSNHNMEKIESYLSKLKLYLTKLQFLPIELGEQISKQELVVARDILEIGAFFSIETKNIPAFERYMAQLKCYYFDYSTDLTESTFKYQLLGLNLLCLLSQNRVSEFHTELELLPMKEIQNNVYIRHPVSLEQYLMEGSYNKIFLSKGNVPSKYYTFFIDILLDTIREDIAGCIEMAYDRISESEALRLLFFDAKDKAGLVQYAQRRRWTLNQKREYTFGHGKNRNDGAVAKIPAQKIAVQMLEYARELEMIV
ncbi:regulatory particle non-ATPase 12 [Dermatophagoides farinae]|uniref:26S proteasome non-ATPase regulatory subunit 8 n=1 Tax=Dermatophagoides farinae TaxID=6954 RepID=A0A922KZI2_DERFA|nr:26S proteasome non-ATPase regulatory subunit 8-like [Dermatophagoides farinae]KAH7640122.1 26s proteasome non-atpase regulatory subunit 8-like protein [Dermatophagoides farinae]KAH9506740.1 26S proteasome non-ATPase regulatory subunit 8 [Dermatophagoides farinae]